jgi:hypothetical protein
VFWSDLCRQLDGVASAAATVASSVLADHTAQQQQQATHGAPAAAAAAAHGPQPAAARGKRAGARARGTRARRAAQQGHGRTARRASARPMSALASCGGGAGTLFGALLSPPSATPSVARPAEARRHAFIDAALRRCVARLGGGEAVTASGAAAAGEGAAAADPGGGVPVGDGAEAEAETKAVRRTVDGLLAAATSADNLARMYEGWQAWL